MATTGSVGSGLSRSVADGTGTPGTRQGAVFAAALVGWALLAVADGGQDWGNPLVSAGPTAAALALIVGAPLAAFTLRSVSLGRGPARLALGAAAALVVWSAASIGWAVAPDLAWTETNRAAIALVALALGIAAGRTVRRAADRFPTALAVVAALPIGISLLGKIFPTALGEDADSGRLSLPVGYWNALALVAAMAVPGVMLWCRRTPGPRAAAIAAAASAALLVTTVLTLSRGGAIAVAVAITVTLVLAPSRRVGVVVACGAIGAIVPALWGVMSDDLTRDGLAAADRASAGAVLGIALVGGVLVAAGLAWFGAERVGVPIARRAAERIVVVVIVLGSLAPLLSVAASAGDIVNCNRGAVANDPGRLTSIGANQRGAWWCQAARGWAREPVAGNGAGSFPVVQLRERRDGNPTLTTVEPHQMWLAQASALGAVGVALLIALWAAVGWAAWRLRARMPAGVAAILAAALVQAQTDFTLSLPVIVIPVMAAIGLLVTCVSPEPTTVRPRRPGAQRVALGLLAAVAVASAAFPLASMRMAAASSHAFDDGDLAGARSAAEQAVALNPLSLEARFLEAQALRYADPASALAALREATDRQPENPKAWRRLAIALGQLKKIGRAGDAWGRVHILDPYDPRARTELGITSGPPDSAAR